MKLLAEIAQSGSGDAVGSGAQINLIEIEIENALLGVGALDPDREDRFLRLAQIGLLARQKEVLRNLLRDGGGAFLLFLCRIVVDGAKDAAEVEAVVLIEILVFRGEERVDDHFRHCLNRNVNAPLFGKLRYKSAVACMNARNNRRLIGRKLVVVRQIFRNDP